MKLAKGCLADGVSVALAAELASRLIACERLGAEQQRLRAVTQRNRCEVEAPAEHDVGFDGEPACYRRQFPDDFPNADWCPSCLRRRADYRAFSIARREYVNARAALAVAVRRALTATAPAGEGKG